MNDTNHHKEVITGFLILIILTAVVLGANYLTQEIGEAEEVSKEKIVGTGEGYKGEIKIQLVMEDGDLKGLKAVEFHDTSQVFNDVLKSMEKDLLSGKSLEEIDVITGATATYQGIMEALKEAFAQLEK